MAAELLSVPLGSFTAERNARAKAARADGDRDLAARIGALPKPSVSAWLIDMLAREAPGELQRVLDLGEELRRAQQEADSGRLRELAAARRSLLQEVARAAAARAEDVGQRVGGAVLEEVQQTLQAALASPAAAAAVRTGRLVRALDADGLDPVDLDGAVAGGAPEGSPGPRPARTGGRAPEDDEREAAARREAEERARRLAAARARAQEADAEAMDAAATAEDRQRDAVDLRRRVEELRTRLAAAEQARDAADAAAAATRRAADDAAAEVDRIATGD